MLVLIYNRNDYKILKWSILFVSSFNWKSIKILNDTLLILIDGFFGIVLENHNNIKKGNQKNASPIDRDTLNYYIILIIPTC